MLTMLISLVIMVVVMLFLFYYFADKDRPYSGQYMVVYFSWMLAIFVIGNVGFFSKGLVSNLCTDISVGWFFGLAVVSLVMVSYWEDSPDNGESKFISQPYTAKLNSKISLQSLLKQKLLSVNELLRLRK